MAEVVGDLSADGSPVSSEIDHSTNTSDDCSQSAVDDSDDQPSSSELDSLRKESDMPLDKLVSIYGGHLHSTLPYTCTSNTGGNGIVSSTLSPSSSSSSSLNDDEYLPENDRICHQMVPVGPDHQAVIPELLHRCTLVGSCDEHLLWDPSRLPESKVEKYCNEVMQHCSHLMTATDGTHVNKMGLLKDNSHTISDDEQALYLLLQCNYNVHEALRRHQMQAIPPTDPLSLWTNEERANFIAGLKLYGKDFYEIQQHKVRTRSVGELVHVYYLWKKTDEYASFTGKPYNFRRQTQLLQRFASIGDSSFGTAQQSESHHQTSSSRQLHDRCDSFCLDPSYMMSISPAMPQWDVAVLNNDLDNVYSNLRQKRSSNDDISTGYSPSTLLDSFRDQYYFTHVCVECPPQVDCSFGQSAKRLCSSSSTGSPVVCRGISGDIPASARAALYFPTPPDDTISYRLLTQAENSRNSRVHSYSRNGGEMLA